MNIHCAHDEMVSLRKLKPHPKNPNKHPKEQIERLADILKYQGIRRPIKVSKLSGFVTAGHGLIKAARKLGLKELPVNYQDYKDETQEYADLVADNEIAKWATTDFKMVDFEVGQFGPEPGIEMLGIQNFSVDASEKGEKKERKPMKCPECGYGF